MVNYLVSTAYFYGDALYEVERGLIESLNRNNKTQMG